MEHVQVMSIASMEHVQVMSIASMEQYVQVMCMLSVTPQLPACMIECVHTAFPNWLEGNRIINLAQQRVIVVGWSVDLSVGWVVGRLVCRSLVCGSVGCGSVGLWVGWFVGWSVCGSVGLWVCFSAHFFLEPWRL